MKTENIANLKKMRLEFKWSQEQLAELSGLSIRTIQRIENREKPSVESLKSLSAVFEVDFYISDTQKDIEEKQEYVTKLKIFGEYVIVFIVLQIIMIINAIDNPDNWSAFFTVLAISTFGILLTANYTFGISDKLKNYFINKKFNP